MLNWRAGGYALLGAIVGGAGGLLLGQELAPRLDLPHKNGDARRFASSALLVGASIGAVVGATVAGPAPAPQTPTA